VNIEEIRAEDARWYDQARKPPTMNVHEGYQAVSDRHELLAEVDRLTAQLASAREVIRQVAYGEELPPRTTCKAWLAAHPEGGGATTVLTQDGEDGPWTCGHCDWLWQFTDLGPTEHGIHYCPGCGRRVAEVRPWVPEEGA